MKKIISVFFIFLFSSFLYASPINKVVFLGDSLSDDGNLYKLLFKIIPKSPPYFKGRFTNGPTWAEYVGKHFYDKYYIDYKIYAYGGATAIFHLPTAEFIAPTTLYLELLEYLISSIFDDKSQTLFVIWIGANDYLWGRDIPDPDVATSKVVDRIKDTVIDLVNRGAKNFLIMGMPNLARIPFARERDMIEELGLLTFLHDQKLELEIQKIKNANPDLNILFFEVKNRLSTLIDHPEVYNKKYHINITETKERCWMGGFTVKNLITEQGARKELLARIKMENAAVPDEETTTKLVNLMVYNPEIRYVYTLGKLAESGLMPCQNPHQYVFWDSVHPTAIVHQILSIQVERELDQLLVGKLLKR